RHQGGVARVLSMAFTEPAEEDAVIAEFNAARDAEYTEVLSRFPAFHQELADERARGNATYVEVEESEADLERFRTWLSKIAVRDYFQSPGGLAARDAEYTEVLSRLPAFHQELADERARGNATYVEVEESEADLERFRTWLSKIAVRDYFQAPG